jgi:hypothetical protein
MTDSRGAEVRNQLDKFSCMKVGGGGDIRPIQRGSRLVPFPRMRGGVMTQRGLAVVLGRESSTEYRAPL